MSVYSPLKGLFPALVVLFLVATVTIDGHAQKRSKVYSFNTNYERGYLGISIQDITPRLKERKKLTTDNGAYVSKVMEDGPAEKAGVEEGDVIVKFGDRTIDETDDLMRALRKADEDKDVAMEVIRNGQRKTLTVRPDTEFPDEAGLFEFDGGRNRAFVLPPRPPKTPMAPRAPEPFRFRMFSTDRLEGLQVQDLTRQLAEYFEVPGGRGVLVTEVEKKSEAEKAGFKAGDVITKVDGATIRDVDDIMDEIDRSEKEQVPFEVLRKGKATTVTLKVEAYDDDDEDDDYSFYFHPRHRDHLDASMSFKMQDLKKDMRELREHLKSMKGQLREQMQDLRRQLKVQFKSL